MILQRYSENYKIKEQMKETYLLLVHNNTISFSGEHFLTVVISWFWKPFIMFVSDMPLPFV